MAGYIWLSPQFVTPNNNVQFIVLEMSAMLAISFHKLSMVASNVRMTFQ